LGGKKKKVKRIPSEDGELWARRIWEISNMNVLWRLDIT